MDWKTLIQYILKSRWEATITEIVKLCYFVDLAYFRNEWEWKQITNYEYVRYYYWPFDEKIVDDVKELTVSWFLEFKIIPTYHWQEYIAYSVNNEEEICLNPDHKKTVDRVLFELSWYRSSKLTDLAYETKPMKAINAKKGENKNLLDKLEFDAE